MLRAFPLLSLCALLVASLAVQAEIYKWTDEHGRSHFTDQPPVAKPSARVELSPLNTYEAPSKILIDETLARPISRPGHLPGVVMYSTSWCGVCIKAKNWFRSNRIRYTEYDVEKSERGKRDFEKLGGRGVPVILVGKQRMNGFSPARMLQMLRNAGYHI